MPGRAFHLTLPENRTSAAVFASPHSGRDYPWHFLNGSDLDERVIRSSEDAFVDLLFAAAPEHGAPLLTAIAPRAYIDLNRAEDELDPALIEGARSAGHNPRVASGLGVIPRVVANGRVIRKGRIPMREAKLRIETYYRPYHDRLQQLLNESIALFGRAILIDCHSMPREALVAARYPNNSRPDIVLGDLFGAACGSEVIEMAEAAFHGAGFSVARNAPFAGAYITRAYGRPARQQHALQVEIDRSLYMNEALVRPGAAFMEVRDKIARAVAEIAEFAGPGLRLAAE